ncbi:MAG: lecithin retinol acyltransferase family protein [Nocardioides sp.]
MGRGNHIYVRRGRRYSHHGIDCGDGSVIHYVGLRGSDRYVARTSLAQFAAGSTVKVRSYKRRLGSDETIRNAESRLGSVGYHLVRNNCEHFAAWCSTGRAASIQVRRWVLATQGTIASLVAAQSMGAHLAILGTVGAASTRWPTHCAAADGSLGDNRGGHAFDGPNR